MTTSPGPHSGGGTSGLIDDTPATLAERRSAWLGDGLTAITLIATLTGQAKRCLPESGTTLAPTATAGIRPPRSGPPAPTRPAASTPESPVAGSRWPYDWLARPCSQLHNRTACPPLHVNPYPALHASSYADSRSAAATGTR